MDEELIKTVTKIVIENIQGDYNKNEINNFSGLTDQEILRWRSLNLLKSTNHSYKNNLNGGLSDEEIKRWNDISYNVNSTSNQSSVSQIKLY